MFKIKACMMSFKEFKASVSTSRVAGPQQQQPTTSTSKHLTTDIAKESSTMSSPTPSTSSTTSSNQEPASMKMGKLFGFIDDTYRDIRRMHSGLHKDVYNTQLMQTINRYKNGCNKIFEEVLESYVMSKKLAQNIVRTIDIFKELCTSLTDLEEYQHRVCELMAIFIACELRLSVDCTIQDQLLIGHRIIFIMRRHLEQEVEEETRYNILKTLVYLPRLFNARDIMCAIFGQFIPMKPVSDVNVLPDKLYMLYIIVFYRWMMMQKDDDDKLLIVNFAESFMKPSVTLCTNQLYATHLPRYTTHSTATRTILNNMKFYRDIRNASIIDNALKKIGAIVDLCDDDEEDADLVILDSPNSTEFAEIFSVVQFETLGDSMSNIKLEEETLIGTVDLTEDEEESTNFSNTIHGRHEEWLNNFQQLAKQFRESQLIMERQQSNLLVSNNQREAIICLDSDSENEDEELTVANANTNATQEIIKRNTEKSSELTEDLFVDNYPPTVTPINCSTDLESSDVEDDDDSTKLSSRFLSGTIRTYQAKRIHQIESQANTETAYRRDSIHISSTPPDRLDDEYSDNQDDEGTDVQDEHDQEEDEVETFPSITLQEPRPRGPYPTYNNMQNHKVVFSQSITRLPFDNEQQNQQTQQSDVKSPKKQKKKVHFNTSPLGPTIVQNKPLKPALQQSKYKASDAPDYFHLRGFERLATSAPSTTGSTSTCGSVATTLSLNKQQEQQELTTEHCNENENNENNKREIKRSFKLNHNNNNKCLKNLSVFNQKYLLKQKSFKNVKINLKKLKLNNDISLTNSKSSFSIEKQPPPPTPPLHTSLTLLHNKTTFLNYKQTETCQLKTKLIDTITTASNLKTNVIANDDDAIFKKPLPVTRKFVKSPKPIKIHKVVSLKSQPFYNKTKTSAVVSSENDGNKGDEHILEIPLVTHIEKLGDEVKTETVKSPLLPSVENNVNDANAEKSSSKEVELDDLSKISKFLTDEINNLTSEHKKTNIEKTNMQIMHVEDINEKNKAEEKPDKIMEIKISHDVDSDTDNASSENFLANDINRKPDIVMEKRLIESDIYSQNSDETSSINSTEQESNENISQATEQEYSDNQNGKNSDEKEEACVETAQQENTVEKSKTTVESHPLDDKKEHEKEDEVSVETDQQGNRAKESKITLKSQSLDDKKEEEISVEADQQENAAEKSKTTLKSQFLDNKKENGNEEDVSVETDQQETTSEKSKTTLKSQFLDDKKENEKEQEVPVEIDQQENTVEKSKTTVESQFLDNKNENEKEEVVSVETDQQESTAEKSKTTVKSQFLDNKKENEKEEISVETDQQENTAEKSKTNVKSQSHDNKKEDEKELVHNETDQQENTAEKSKTTTKNQSLINLNEDTLMNSKEACDIDKSNSNCVATKDEKSLEISDQDNATNISNDDINSSTDLNNTEDFNCNAPQEFDALKPGTQTASSPLVTHFCAEFLAGLPNESSSAVRNVSNTENDPSRNDIDFEFENNSSTPTMCRFDLDSMTENTSDIPPVMSVTKLTSETYDADKLLEDFNNKTEDIVDTALSKKTNQSNPTELRVRDNKENNQNTLISTHTHESIKRSRESEDILDNTGEQTHKKFITTISSNESSQEMETAVKNQETECVVEKCLQHENKHMGSKQVVVANCIQPDKEIRENTKPDNQANKRIKLENNQSEVMPPQLDSFPDTSNDSLHKMEAKTQKPLKSHRKSKHNHENYHGTPLKKIKKSHKQQINAEATKIQSPVRKTSEDCKKSDDLTEGVNCSSSTEKLENNTISEKEIPKQMETSINDSEHMTLELGNWKQDARNENKPNNSESSGVSAIFSFPKIPIISISICTTPNNKTYFKISKRGNDDTQSKEVGKVKQQEVNVSESKNGDQLVKAISEDLSCKEKINSTSDLAEIKEEEDQLTEEEQTTENNVEEEDEDYEEEEDEEETETDNIEIEKFSHDSNSACSLPLKKRPTQSEPNDETEDSESADVVNSEQPEEIAAEVVIEDSDKVKQIFEHNSSETEEILSENEEEHNRENIETSLKNIAPEISNIDDNAFMLNDFDDNKPSTSAASFKKLIDPSSPFKRRVNNSIRPIGQPPVQIVTPQLKGNSPSPSQDCRTADAQVPNAPRMLTNSQPLPESYPATPMLSVANVEKLMDLNRFIEDLLASPDVMTIIDNANACGYFAEGQAYEMERIAILEHYNIANAKGNTSATKPLYWKKSAGDTISIFNDNDNEWIALPPSTAKQLLKLSFVLSILQQQYKVSDVRQRINIALTFLIQTSCSSKFKSNTNNSSLQQRMQVYSRTISDVNINNNNNIPQPLPSTSYFRIATNNDALNTNFNINSNIDAVQDIQTNNYSNAQHQQTDSVSMPQEHTNNTSSQTWNNIVQFGHGTDQLANSSSTHHVNANSTENEQQQQQQQQQQQLVQQDKRNTTWDELINDQLYINPPCATSPQNEVIVNTNGVQLHEMPQNYQDQQNIFISITDESAPTIGGSSDSTHKYNTRQQQQQQQQRTLDEREHIPAPTSTSPTTQSYCKRQYLGNSNTASLIQNSLSNNRNNIITVFGSQEINLQNPYRMQQNFQQQQRQQQQPQSQSQTSKPLNTTSSPGTSFQQQHHQQQQQQQQQVNMSLQNLPINMNKNVRPLNTLTQQKPQQQRMSTRYTSNFNSQQQQQTAIQLQNSQTKVNESNYKEILQPYITYLIKDHEKTSKHLLQVFEEVSNSNPSSTANINTNNFSAQQEQQLNSILPPLIRNPQQNHMPDFQLTPCDRNMSGILPSLIRNPNQTVNITNRDSGALQVVQSFLDQTQPVCQQQQEKDLTETPTTFLSPDFAKEYVNFVGSRDEVVYKQKLHKFNAVQQEYQQQEKRQDQLIKEAERLNYVKRKCQERNDKLAEDLKRKIMEFSHLKHNVQIKLLEKQQNEEVVTTKRRGRPKKKLATATDSAALAEDKQRRTNPVSRRNRRKQVSTDLPSGSTTMDHAYFRQRTASREASKRINAAVNNSFQ